MKVKLAVVVLSKSVAIALRETGKEYVTWTAVFCETINGFYDCTSVRSLTEHVRKKNAFIKPYESAEDERLAWLKDVFRSTLKVGNRVLLNVKENRHQMKDRRCSYLSKLMKV